MGILMAFGKMGGFHVHAGFAFLGDKVTRPILITEMFERRDT